MFIIVIAGGFWLLFVPFLSTNVVVVLRLRLLFPVVVVDCCFVPVFSLYI